MMVYIDYHTNPRMPRVRDYGRLMDQAADRAAELMRKALDAGRAVGFAANCAEAVRVPVGKGEGQNSLILLGLAKARPVAGDTLKSLLSGDADVLVNAEIYIFTLNPDQYLSDVLDVLRLSGNIIQMIEIFRN
jgi:uncharacterized protein (DUF58 family)